MLKDDSTITVVHVSTVEEALSVIPPVGVPSCVLLDLSLPDSDGLEGLAEIRRFAPHAPTIVLTGREDDALCFRAMAEGAQDYLVKGHITGEILRRSIRYAVERKSTAAALLDASQRFRLAFEHSPTGIALMSVRPNQHGVVLDANPAFAALLGRSLDTVLGEDLIGLVHPEDIGRFALQLRAITTGERTRADATYSLTGNETLPALCRVSGSLLRDSAGIGDCALIMFEDVTLEARREKDLGQALEALNEASCGIALLDIAGNYVSLNRAHALMLGFERQQLLGRSWQLPFGQSDREKISLAVSRASTGQAQRVAARGQRANGSMFDAEIEIVAKLDREGALAGLHYFLRDVSWRRQPSEAMVTEITGDGVAALELAHLASHDELTGLPNRSTLLEHLRNALLHSRRGARTVGLFVIALDGFKNVSDTLGRQAGDEVLHAVVPRLQQAVRTSDLLARFGVDEFVAVCADLNHEEDAHIVAHKLAKALAAPLPAKFGSIRMRSRIGVALSHGTSTSAEEMLREADTAMCRTNQSVGAGYEIFDDPMRAELLAGLQLERDIPGALRQGQFRLAYQPIVSTRNRAMIGCEALARWTHPIRGEIGPNEFIPIAEEAGSIIELGDWVLGEACRQLALWSREGSAMAGLTMWINVSGRQFDDPGFPRRVKSIVAATGIDPLCLRFEVTETALLDTQSSTAMRVIDELRVLGIRIALDDFGTGYSSLSHVRRLPISAIKLDRTFVSQPAGDEATVTIVDAIATMARSLSISLVAEGIETEEQMAVAIEHGCPLAQGYLFARPMPNDELGQWAARRSFCPPGKAPPSNDTAALGIGAAAASLGVSPSTIRRWADCGRLGSVRTKGGHRRILAADVRNEARRLMPNVKLNLASLPSGPASQLASLLESHGEAALTAAATDVYTRRNVGWFGAESSLRPRRQWVASLGAASRTGDFAKAIRSSITFFHQADIAGATVLERHLLAERFRVRLVRLLRTSDANRADIYTLVKLMQAIEQATLGAA